MRSSPPGGISAHPSPPPRDPRDPRIEEKCGAIPRLQPDQGPGRGANADRVGFRGRKKTFLRGGGVGGGDGRGEGHTREPQLAAVAATCRRVPREPRDPACLPVRSSFRLSIP